MPASKLPLEGAGFTRIGECTAQVDARNLDYRQLNALLRNQVGAVHVENVLGQRYLGTCMRASLELHVYGTPGNDLAAFMDGGKVVIHGNAQDGVGNTMNSGVVIIHGKAGDIAGYSMRGGEMYIRDDVGYRCGIHMKQYGRQIPTVVVGGTGQDYMGEYMAGGVLVVMGLTLGPNPVHRARFVGTGMHGGVIYIRGKIEHICKDIQVEPLGNEDFSRLSDSIGAFATHLGSSNNIEVGDFVKLVPLSKRPYGQHYTR